MKDLIAQIFKNYNFELNNKQIEQFYSYYTFLIQENEKFNLTAITDPLEVIVKHFVDSVLAEKYIKNSARIIDVGTGAGFPGVPLKILRPDIKVTLLDSLQKRVNFLNQLIDKLQLKEINAVHARAEDYVKEEREKFDVALSRAVAQIPTLSEYLLPYVKIGGKAIMYKGLNIDEELEMGRYAIKTLGGEVESQKEFELQEVSSSRSIIIISKTSHTPTKYPRGKNQPRTNPLIENTK